MLKNCFCPGQYCSTKSQSSFNYQTLATTLQPLDQEAEKLTIEEKLASINRCKKTAESCSSSCRSNSIENPSLSTEDSGSSNGGGFTFLSSTSTTTSSLTNNSIHFYHPKSIQTSPGSNCSRVTDEELNKKQQLQMNTNICKNLISNLTPLSESIKIQLQKSNKENLKSVNRIKKLITSTAVINLKPTPPSSQPPSLDSKKLSGRFNLGII